MERTKMGALMDEGFGQFLGVFGVFGVFAAGACFAVYLMVAETISHREKTAAIRVEWEGASVTKICKSGDYIWKLRDGRYVTARGHTVPSPSVCE